MHVTDATLDQVSFDEVVIEGEIALNRLDRLKGNLASLNARLEKAGLPEITLEVGKAKPRHFLDESEGIATHIMVATVTMRGPAYRRGDYRLIGSIDHASEPVAFRSVIDAKIPPEYLRPVSKCDHCGTNRNRNLTYLLASTQQVRDTDHQQRYLQVGSACLLEYTGISPSLALIATSVFAEWRAFCRAELDIDQKEHVPHVRGALFPLLPFLESVAHYVRTCGWTSRSRSRELAMSGSIVTATADLAVAQLRKDRLEFLEADLAQKDPHVTKDDRELARQALDHAKAAYVLDDENPMDAFAATLASIAHSLNVEEDLLGEAAYLVQAYLKSRAEKRSRESISEWFGQVNEKIATTVEVLSITPLEGFHGVKLLHRMVDDEGHVFVWFGSGKPLKVGERTAITATVKSHDTYRDLKQTVLIRVKSDPKAA